MGLTNVLNIVVSNDPPSGANPTRSAIYFTVYRGLIRAAVLWKVTKLQIIHSEHAALAPSTFDVGDVSFTRSGVYRAATKTHNTSGRR